MLVLIRGAGDLASGIALRLFRSGMQVVMTDLPQPTAIRRTVSFSQAIVYGETRVEDVTARLATVETVPAILEAGEIPVLADPACRCREILKPDALRRAFSCLQSVCRMQESQHLRAFQRGLGPAAGRAVGRGGESSEFSTS